MSETRPHAASAPHWGVAAALTVVLFLAYVLRFVLLPLAFAAALAFVLHPLVRRLHEHLRLPRLAAVLIVYFLVLAVLGLAAWYVVAGLGGHVLKALDDAPKLLSEGIARVIGPQAHLFGQTISANDLAKRALQAAQDWLAQPLALMTTGVIVVAAPATIVLTLVTLFYFINSGRRLARGVLWLAPPSYRPDLRRLWRRIEPMLRQYVQGVALVVLYTTAAAWLVLGPVFHLPFALLLSFTVGVLELVPVVGPAASMALIGVTAVLNGGGLWAFAGFMVFAIALRVSIDEIVGPLVLGRAVTLHPVVIIIAFLIASTLFGVLGVFFAVPVAASIKIALGALYGDEATA